MLMTKDMTQFLLAFLCFALFLDVFSYMYSTYLLLKPNIYLFS